MVNGDLGALIKGFPVREATQGAFVIAQNDDIGK
jgi:hypothetical protein